MDTQNPTRKPTLWERATLFSQNHPYLSVGLAIGAIVIGSAVVGAALVSSAGLMALAAHSLFPRIGIAAALGTILSSAFAAVAAGGAYLLDKLFGSFFKKKKPAKEASSEDKRCVKPLSKEDRELLESDFAKSALKSSSSYGNIIQATTPAKEAAQYQTQSTPKFTDEEKISLEEDGYTVVGSGKKGKKANNAKKAADPATNNTKPASYADAVKIGLKK